MEAPVIQWFRGELEASYLGVVQPEAGPPRYELRIYRAVVRHVVLIEPPAAAEPPAALEGATRAFVQPTIDDCSVTGVGGRGSIFRGPIFDVTVQDFELTHPTKHAGRAYGRLAGSVVAWCELPSEAPKPAPSATIPTNEEVPTEPETPRARAGELLFNADPELAAVAVAHQTADDTLEELTLPTAQRSPVAAGSVSSTSLYVLAVAVALGLGVGCSIEPALLWCAFLLPTLLARSLFSGVFRDSTGVRTFGVVLILAQLVAVSSLVSGWWSSGCRELELLPLLGIVAVLFPAGLLPSTIPLSFNGAGLALVLGLWCSAPASACRAKATQQPATLAAPTVKDPGVPRTNQDGSWPKRPPG